MDTKQVPLMPPLALPPLPKEFSAGPNGVSPFSENKCLGKAVTARQHI